MHMCIHSPLLPLIFSDFPHLSSRTPLSLSITTSLSSFSMSSLSLASTPHILY